ncbi:MAG: hypothetical protein CVU10_05220 [Bacteroidetes bacterium HGW-Bacteroidetes-5]|jgi:PAS domain S-box-containing protein|nr:MAG: hypothetical protein CVU10_05220 [Bacteroidetes bacterium HGW-Bacteroidetes-5]
MARILAIDDIQDNLISIKAIIADAFPDIEVYTALSGRQGVELARRVIPDIILLDILMPGMDGYEVCKIVKSDPNLEDIPVVFVTALKESRQNRIQALEAGAEAFLTKPIDETEMISQIKAMLKIRAANVFKRDEKIRLEALVKSRTQELERELNDRIKADEEVRNSEEKHRALVNQMQLGLAVHKIILNKKGEAVDYLFLDVNPAYERITGLKKERVIGRRVLEVLPNIEKIWIEKYGNVALTGEPVSFESYARELGRYFNVIAYKNRENEFAVIVEDITKDKRDEQMQQVLYEISRASANAILQVDILRVVRSELCKVLDANNFFVASYNPETDKLKKIIFLDDNDSFEEWEAKDTLSGLVIKTEKSILTSKEEIIKFAKEYGINLTGTLCESWLGVPIFIEHKAIGVMVVQSYSEKNAYDAKSMRLMEMIAHEIAIVMQRISMIENLIRAKERAEESDRLKTAFLANMSHEIRTPMNGIMGFLQLLNDVDLTSDDRQYYFEIINKSGERLLSTINDIIEISKIESGQLNVIYNNVNIKEILNFHYKFFINQTEEKGISLLLKNSEEIADVIVSDQHILDGILTNLIKNAIKFTDSGEIEVGTYLKDESIIFYVRDTGIGISKTRQEAIFERFVQADLDYKRPHEGSGLGLSIVKAYSHLMKGEVWVESEEGRGSTFYFAVPYIPVILKREIPSDKSIRADGERIHKILIAEDDEISYKLLEKILSDEKFTIIHVWNGEEAVCVMRDDPEISMILMDLRMPLTDGLDAAKKIRQFNKTVKIIAVTVNAFSIDKEIALNSGCDDYVLKPVNKKLLTDIIEKHLYNI